MAEYTLTEAVVRECFQSSAEGLDFKRGYYERGETFDRWLAGVRREAAEEAKADLWDELIESGQMKAPGRWVNDHPRKGLRTWVTDPNPYMKESTP